MGMILLWGMKKNETFFIRYLDYRVLQLVSVYGLYVCVQLIRNSVWYPRINFLFSES